MNTKPGLPMLILGLAAGSLLLLGACSGAEAEKAAVKETPGTIVLGARDLYTVQARQAASGVRVTGSLDPKAHADVKAQLSGQLDRVLVERGARVSKGQLLAVFDSRAQRAQLSAARAQLGSAERDLGAADMLFKAGAAAERDYVQARVARDAAAAQVTQAQETVSRSTVEAPVGGTITDKLVTQGEAVQTGAKLFSIANISTLELKGHIDADQIAAIRVGQTVDLSLDAYPGKRVSGRVQRIDAVADPQTRQVTAYIEVANTDRAMVGGLFTTGIILTSSGQSELPVVPESALVKEAGGAYVYEVVAGTIRKTPVEIGSSSPTGGMVEISRGLAPGSRILTAPGESIKVGAPVSVTATVAASGGDQ